MTESGLVFGTPDYESRNIEVTSVDLSILKRADELLSEEIRWEKNSMRACRVSGKLNLYCALERASIEVMGKHVHRQPALQEVRFVIDDNFEDRWASHRLADFNAHRETTFGDIKFVLNKAIFIVKSKILHNSYNP